MKQEQLQKIRGTGMSQSDVLLVVNADDLGMIQAISRGIVEAHIHGIVTSASLMTTTPWAGDGAAQAARCPELGVGVHLTLTCGMPVASPFEVSSLVDSHGRLLDLRSFMLRWASGKLKLRHLQTELRAQVRKAMQLGIRPTHLDSHHHLHLLPGVLKIVLKLAAEHGIGTVRFPRRWRFRPFRVSGLYNWLLYALTVESRRRRFLSEKIRSSDQVWILSPGGSGPLWKLYQEALESAHRGMHEFLCHPGFNSPELEAMDSYAGEREAELAALSQPELCNFVRWSGIRTGNFGSFHHSS
jgi:predicted glycoside hydrolase/deacetylase ChbG (UPF0249 family)